MHMVLLLPASGAAPEWRAKFEAPSDAGEIGRGRQLCREK